MESDWCTKTHQQEWEFWAPHQIPMPGDLTLGERAPGASGIEGLWSLCAGAPQDWGKWKLHSGKIHTHFHMHWVPRQSKVSRGIWVKPVCSSWRTSWENRDECGLLCMKDIGSKAFGSIEQHAFFWRWPFLENLAPPISQLWEAPGQTTIQVGSHPRPSVNRLPKVPTGTRPHLIPSRDKALPTRGIRISSNYQWTGTTSSH